MHRIDYRFPDRAEAGRLLGRLLARLLRDDANRGDVSVLALPRGGVPVAVEVARALRAPLDVFLVRKLGAPGHPELAMGAIATGGVRVVEPDTLRALRITQDDFDRVAAVEQQELARYEKIYRGDRPPIDVRGRTVIVVDDGLATGSTMLAALVALRKLDPARIIVAVPVAPPSVCEDFRREGHEVVCPLTPEPFEAVGLWYEDFRQTSDDEVRELLARATED